MTIHKKTKKNPVSVSIAVLTISDTRTETNDTSGKTLADRLLTAGHTLKYKAIIPDNKYRIRALVAQWIAEDNLDVIISTGGTGLTANDVTPEAVTPLFDKKISGFGELFRYISFQEIKTSTVQSRAIAGVANGTFIFCLPGSTGACRTAWDKIIQPQLDINHRPCNFIEIMPRLRDM